jgi:hypothetical protein
MEMTRSLTLVPLPATLRPASAACRRRRRRRGLPFGALFSPSPPSNQQQQEMHIRALQPRQDWVGEWVRSNDTLVRGLPILGGGASLLAVLLNRAVSGIAAVADASSSQSRADILTLALSVTDILAGLVWLSIRPKSISPVSFLSFAAYYCSKFFTIIPHFEMILGCSSRCRVQTGRNGCIGLGSS